jgi:ribosomal protein S18 acetylase RimI-like enzyme
MGGGADSDRSGRRCQAVCGVRALRAAALALRKSSKVKGGGLLAQGPAAPILHFWEQVRRLLRSVGRYARCLRVTLAIGGSRHTAHWVAFGLFRFNRFAILVRDLRTVRPPRADDAVYELWTAERLGRWREERPGLPTQFYQDRIDGVALCAVAHRDGTVMGLIWVYGPDHYSRMFRLRHDEVELNQGLVLPEHRDRGLFTRLLDFACLELAGRGVRIACAAVHAENRRSLRAFRAAGFTQRAAVRHVFLFRPTVTIPPAVSEPPAAWGGQPAGASGRPHGPSAPESSGP